MGDGVSRFVLVDHSLRVAGSHHLDYARLVLSEAEDRGFEVHVIAHRDFDPVHFPRRWNVRSRFRYDLYHKYCVAGGRGVQPAFGREKWIKRIRHPAASLREGISRWRRRRHFSRVCNETLGSLQLLSDDVVFFPAMSEFDLEAMVNYLGGQPVRNAPQYHVQFHFGVLPTLAVSKQRRCQLVSHYRKLFCRLSRQLEKHQVCFYGTTDGLVEEFNQFVPRMCTELPYPVNPDFRISTRTGPSSAELQITCAGLRPEQGQQFVGPVVDTIGTDYLGYGKARLQIQIAEAGFEALLGGKATGETSLFARLFNEGVIQRVPFPLAAEQFQQLIQGSDLLLFLYDRARYSIRCSSILVEALTAGIPVIVPAGCWLGDQVSVPTNGYLASLKASTPSVGAQEFLGAPTLSVSRWPVAAGWAIVEFQAVASTTVEYVRVNVSQLDSSGAVVRTDVEIHRRWADERVTRTLVKLDPAAVSFAFGFCSLGDGSRVPMRSVSITYFAGTFCGPKGVVGLVVADADQVPGQLADLLDHYQHYRQAALEHAETWYARHAPAATFETLVPTSIGGRSAPSAERRVA